VASLLQLGDEFIELTDYLTAGGRSIPEDAKSNDLMFQHIAIVVSDMDKSIRAIEKSTTWSMYRLPRKHYLNLFLALQVSGLFNFHDPDDHNLELIWFPKGKGQDKWQHKKWEDLFGNRHTAIGVSNTENSHHFYTEMLGIERKGDSWNKGIEQAHLNNGTKAHRFTFTAVSFQRGTGIEFLQYINPGPGKPYPADSRADDISGTGQTALVGRRSGSVLFHKIEN
jgi:catechol 2,3-dioxygenase-like lactoylglutathione lyase family enzyme